MKFETSIKSGKIDSSEIRKVFDLAAKLKNPKNLSIGQPDFPVPQVVKDALIKAVQEDKNSYTLTQGIVPLREKLSEQWAKEGIDIKPGNILVSTGVASILYLLYDILFNPGDEVLMIEPYFLIYESLGVFHDLKKVYLPENFKKEDIEPLLANAAFKPKAIIFSSPSNPTGKILSKEQITLLSELAQKTGALIVADEIYKAFDYDNKHVSAASVLPEQTISLGGFSKSHAMTGLRVGYIGVPENLSVIIQKISALQQYSVVCSPAPAQWAALAALENPLIEELSLMKRRRDLVYSMLKDNVDFPYPDGAFYVFASIPEDSKSFVLKAVERELLIVPGFIFTRDPNTVRISYAQNEEILTEGLNIFLELVAEKKA